MQLRTAALASCAMVIAGTAFSYAGSFSLKVGGLRPLDRFPDEAASCRRDAGGNVIPGANRSPHLHWTNGPAGTKSYAILMFDRDVPNNHALADSNEHVIEANAPRHEITHWILSDIPAGVNDLQTGESHIGIPGKNARDALGYLGPCPPWNDAKAHRYVLTVYALRDESLHLTPGYSRTKFEEAVGKSLASASTTQLYAMPRLDPPAR